MTGVTTDPQAVATTLAANVPLVLLPVRIETRFLPAQDVGEPVLVRRPPDGVAGELLLRVYPDTISTSSFEPELTDDEIGAGTAYWTTLWDLGGPPPEDRARTAWKTLATRFGPRRAAWVVAVMTPTNIAQRPVQAPTPDSVDVPQPSFPAPPTRASSYERAPTAQGLPDRWTVVLEGPAGRRIVQGGPITPNLAVGLDPRDGVFPDGLPVDAGMRWLVDFDEAVRVGMGIRIGLDADEYAGGFQRILVMGVRDEITPAVTALDNTLQNLLDAHHYTDGIAVVEQGAPTNNTTDASSAWTTADPDQTISFAVEVGEDLASDPSADGPLLARALGVPASVFTHVRAADGHGAEHARDMLVAVWPATFGYFLEQMMSAVLTTGQQDAARSFALDSVRPRGPLPALRVGMTPYGILPTTSLAIAARPRRQSSGSARARGVLAQLCELLLPVWQSSTGGVPRVGATADPDQDLVQMLGMDASSVAYRARQVIGENAFWNITSFLGGQPATESWDEHFARGRALLDSLGLSAWDPRVIHTAMGRDSYPVPYSSVQDAPLSEVDPLVSDAILDGTPVNYISWLAHAPMADVWAETYPGPRPTSILYRVLRQSMLREYVSQAGRAQIAGSLLPVSALREVELVNVDVSAPTITARDIVERPVAVGSKVTWAEYLDTQQPSPSTPPESPVARLAELRAAMDRLASLPTAELDRLLSETLDTGSHRLDAWITAIGTSLLTDQMNPGDGASPQPHVGAFGWLENVAPQPSRSLVAGADAEAVVRLDRARAPYAPARALRPVRVPREDNGGFVQAPSLTQAAAGAVLRSGYLSHRGTPDEPTLAIDLSSSRTAAALWLLDGVRQGLGLGALTGYQFEEQLHEQGLDVYVQPFRDAFPLVGDELNPVTANGAVVAPSMVVDGVKLRTAWQNGALTAGMVWGVGLPAPGDPAQDAVVAMLESIDDMLSGLSDVSIAESVFQIMRGNYGRVGGILDAVSRGEHPPDPDIVMTPRRGTDVTHRLMLLLAGPPPPAPAWSGISVRPRASLEPWLSDWVAGRLPDPATVRAHVSWEGASGSGGATVSLRDLDIGPLDTLALADAADQPQRAELENRILLAAGPPADVATLTISYDADQLPDGSVTFPDFLTAARAVRDLVASARALDLRSFALPDKEPTGGSVDIAELHARVTTLVDHLATDTQSLQTAADALNASPGDAGAIAAVVAALVTASAYGLATALPSTSASTTALLALAKRAVDQLDERAAAVDGSASSVDTLVANAQLVFGGSVVVVPRLVPPDAVGVQSAFAQSDTMQAVDPHALRCWLLQLSHVRPAVARLDTAIDTTRLLGAGRPAYAIAQLPPTADDHWLGLPVAPGTTPANGRVAIEALTTGDPSTAGIFAGLLVDEWLERIPSDATSAGVAFHYDEPNARAPQALLVACCPDDRQVWDLDLVADILDETLDLAKIRGVDLASIQEVGQVVPALYFPFNLQGATPATVFTRLEAIHDRFTPHT
jgi:hypothetical protein